MNKVVNFLGGLMLWTLICGVVAVYPQASSSTADLRGQVTDATGAVIPNASVTLTDTTRGTTRTAVTGEDGEYIFLSVPPSDYDLKVEAAGGSFSGFTRRIRLAIGEQANIPIQLTAAGVAVNVDVTVDSEIVSTERTQQSSVIDTRQVESLPLSRRNYLDLALLTPGVSDSDNINDASDARVAQGRAFPFRFGSGIAIYRRCRPNPSSLQ